MNILVTVGTTRFDSLIKEIEKIAHERADLQFTVQVGKGGYCPQNCKSFEFSTDLQQYIENADLIITHAGAGSIYSLLEKDANLIVVPNLERVDDHQLDLANFVSKNRYAQVAFKHLDIKELIDSAMSFDKVKYTKDAFFLTEYMMNMILGSK